MVRFIMLFIIETFGLHVFMIVYHDVETSIITMNISTSAYKDWAQSQNKLFSFVL